MDWHQPVEGHPAPSPQSFRSVSTSIETIHVKAFCSCSLHSLLYLRSYPTGLGVRMHQLALANPARTPLRFSIPINKEMPDPLLFQSLPLGDIWLESAIHEVFEYLWNSKHCRTAPVASKASNVISYVWAPYWF